MSERFVNAFQIIWVFLKHFMRYYDHQYLSVARVHKTSFFFQKLPAAISHVLIHQMWRHVHQTVLLSLPSTPMEAAVRNLWGRCLVVLSHNDYTMHSSMLMLCVKGKKLMLVYSANLRCALKMNIRWWRLSIFTQIPPWIHQLFLFLLWFPTWRGKNLSLSIKYHAI